MTKLGSLFLVLCWALVQVAWQQSASSSDEVVLDRNGMSIQEFETKAEELANKLFTDLATVTEANVQTIASDFAKNLGLSVANVVVYFNRQGITDVESQSQEAASAVEMALSAAVKEAGPSFESFDVEGIETRIQTSVAGVLNQLQNGSGINDVVNPVANDVLEVAFNAVLQLLTIQSGTATSTEATSTTSTTATTSAQGGSVETPEAAPSTGGSSSAVSGQFTFTAEGKTVDDLRKEIAAQTDAGFAAIESAGQDNVEAAVTNLAVNLTQAIGEVLFTVLSSGDDADKETEAEAIAAVITDSLSAAVANAQGDLQNLDVETIENDVSAAIFKAVADAEEPNADLQSILQTTANSVLASVASALGAALGAEVSGSVSIDYTATSTSGTAAVETVPTEAAPAPTPPVQSTASVSSSNSVTIDQIQANLTQSFESAFTAVEEDPSSPSTQELVANLGIQIASSIGNALLSLSSGDAEDQVQIIVSLFQDALESAVSAASGPAGDFDIAGVVSSIEGAATKTLTGGLSNIQTQVQQLSSEIIDIIIEQLGEVIPGFNFQGSLEVTGTTTTVTVPTTETVTTTVATTPSPTGSFDIASSSSTTTVPATPAPTVPAPTEGECLCLDQDTLNALIDARIAQIIQAGGGSP